MPGTRPAPLELRRQALIASVSRSSRRGAAVSLLGGVPFVEVRTTTFSAAFGISSGVFRLVTLAWLTAWLVNAHCCIVGSTNLPPHLPGRTAGPAYSVSAAISREGK